jgi:MFS family permease
MQKDTLRRALLIIIAFGTMLIFGLVENIKGVSYPLIKAEFGASYEQQGLFVSLLSGGYVLFCLIAGIFLSRFGVKRSLLSGFLCMFLSLGLVSLMPSFPAVGAALFPAYAAFGFFEVGVNALGTQVFTKRAALLMSLLHFFYGAGAILGPLAAGFLTSKASFDWRHIYLLTIPLNLLIFIPTLIARFPKQGHNAEAAGDIAANGANGGVSGNGWTPSASALCWITPLSAGAGDSSASPGNLNPSPTASSGSGTAASPSPQIWRGLRPMCSPCPRTNPSTPPGRSPNGSA